MSNVIKIKRSATASATPNSLEYGELGLNYADGKIYFKNTSNSIVEFAGSVGPKGDAGVAGLAVQGTAPVDTTVLWADTSVSGTAVVPTGGTTGQVLVKSSGSNYATTWTTPVPFDSPTFTGIVTIPAGASISGFAPLASPALTGTPTSTTAAVDTNTTQIATTAYVIGQGYAKLASPTFTGTPLAAANFSPSATNTYDLGTSSLRWRNIYTQDLHLSNGIGDYTIVEGEESLYLVNNKNSKSFKFALIEVDSSEVPKLSEV